jgi:hypothetical protein
MRIFSGMVEEFTQLPLKFWGEDVLHLFGTVVDLLLCLPHMNKIDLPQSV